MDSACINIMVHNIIFYAITVIVAIGIYTYFNVKYIIGYDFMAPE